MGLQFIDSVPIVFGLIEGIFITRWRELDEFGREGREVSAHFLFEFEPKLSLVQCIAPRE